MGNELAKLTRAIKIGEPQIDSSSVFKFIYCLDSDIFSVKLMSQKFWLLVIGTFLYSVNMYHGELELTV